MPAVDVDFYRAPGPLTRLGAEQAAMVRALGPEPETLCRVVQGLVVLPPHATRGGAERGPAPRAEHALGGRPAEPAHRARRRADQ